ncbi:MAG: bifunctional alpha,alpha-trehalose-phosphate synthase (UDP-forming)/trehalose-phosphatase [Flammeovirgaceae bacterium]
MQKTIIVSNRLPVTIKKDGDLLKFFPSAGGLATGLGSIYKSGNNIWLGWPGFHDFREEEKENITLQLKADNMAPVFLTQKDVEDYYEGFSNRTIWPLYHYFTQYAIYEPALWDAYVRVNQKFCDELEKYADPDDIIWIHDYQLLLLPAMLREKLPNATIGFFQHIPFPSFEIFRLMPWREEILNGILGADLIGFHTYDDMRHFLSSINRIVGIGNTMGKIKVGNRLVAVDSFPMGIDYEKFENAVSSEATKQKIERYQRLLGREKIILSIDRLDYSKGIKQRILAFDTFLERYPQYLSKVSLILIVVPSRVQVDQYQQLKAELDELVGRINGKHSRMDWTPIHYFYRSFSFNALSALYSQADVALITPFRDGMNLVCKEYIASKPDQKGVLILSEMAGSARELSEAILINPNDLNQIVEAMKKALEMPEEEQVAHNAEMQSKLKRYNIHRWVEVFMEQLANIKEQQAKMNAKLMKERHITRMLENYHAADKRVFFLDYDGTLRAFTKRPEQAKPDPELLEILEQLTANEKNKVVIISGRDRKSLDGWLGHLNVDMIAEHGVWSKKQGKEWKTIDNLDLSWKERIGPIVDLYVDRTPGSFIEEKDYSLAWHYRKADPDFGEMRARDLLSNLKYFISNMDLTIMEGNKVIEIKNRDVNKGKAARKWLGKNSYGFIFAIGDDVTDEDTFHAMPESAYTIKVGIVPSEATYNVKSTVEVRVLLRKFLE